jgi:hypothetical protein
VFGSEGECDAYLDTLRAWDYRHFLDHPLGAWDLEPAEALGGVLDV